MNCIYTEPLNTFDNVALYTVFIHVKDVKYLNEGSKTIQILCVLKHFRDVIYINKRS